MSVSVIERGELRRTVNSSEKGLSNSTTSLSRKKRFLLFPPGGSLLVTASALKGLLYKAPGGNVLVAELDMFHPLPDYRYRFSAFRLGEVAMLPTEPPKKPPATTGMPQVTSPIPKDPNEIHEVSPEELKEYLTKHPEAYVSPGYNKDRSDWNHRLTYQDVKHQILSDRFKPSNYYNNQFHQPYKSKLWNYDSNNHLQRNFYRSKRSLDEGMDTEWEEELDFFNISHHREWEGYYHYRERRELYHTLENGIEDRFGIPIKSCIMRAICETKNLLPPSGKSMIIDIARIMFSVPLKEDLEDDYSEAMRDRNVDCQVVYNNKCPISLLQLMLFGKFVS
ncbi:uncharacterized protein LOC131428769 [Malaya genurostris]|uniref:uncharacterized protein LOC131428769 n=1 Tax=Malaya genurostris TaxID=325434 RepID=UPI0026F403BE|nr:uncharacterized protein LOC131428769 [Malaya genurostris]